MSNDGNGENVRSHALRSMWFLITTIYTGTFANIVYLMLVEDTSQRFSFSNMAFSIEPIICGTIAVILTLRFFFGNNEYLENVMMDPEKSPWVRFYHFSFIGIQGLILLITSFSIRNTSIFIYGIIGLFILELLWYLITMIVDTEGVLPEDQEALWGFFRAEMTNLGFVVGVGILTLLMEPGQFGWLFSIFILFLGNTAYDVSQNMEIYMTPTNRV